MFTRITLLAFLLSGFSLFGLSPLHPTSDIDWPSSSAVTAVSQIETNFNNARRAEENQFGSIASNAMGDLSLPSQAVWDNMTASEKGLYILNAERTCRAGLDYGSGAVLGLPLEGIELHMQDVSEYYANYLLDNNLFSHNADGIWPWDRIDNNCIIGTSSNVMPSSDCHEFNTRSENLAVFQHVIPGANGDIVAKSLYLFIYEDASSAWGHRAACLIQDVDPETGGGGFTNNRGSSANEGFVGFGLAHGAFNGAPESDLLVMNIFDPSTVADCDYQVIGTTNTYTAPTEILESTGNILANRTRVEKINGEDWKHYLDDNGTPTNDSDDKLLFSLKLDNQYIGTLCDGGFEVKVGNDMTNSTTRITPSTAPYVTTGFDVLSRFWHVDPIKEPVNPVEFMFYYTNTELVNILAVSDGATTASDLTWFKFETAANIDPDPANGHSGATTSDLLYLSPTFGTMGSHFYMQSPVTSFSGGGGGTSQGAEGDPIEPPPLAVDLLYFEGKETTRGNLLKWATASEYNSSHFIIERSEDGDYFDHLETIDSEEFTQSMTEYELLDDNIKSSTHYYQLWEVSLDGEKTDLGIVVIENKDISNSVSIFPNPVQEYLNIDNELKYEADFIIYDINGNVVLSGLWQKGESIDLSTFSPGQYFINMDYGDAVSSSRIIKI